MKKVRSGDPLSIKADDWNRLVDLAGTSFNQAGGSGEKSQSTFGLIWVFVKNTSGADRDRYDCMSLGDLVFNVETNAQQDVIFEAKTAASDKTAIILLESIANNRIGRAAIFGPTLAKVAVASSTSLMAAEPNASGHNLTASASGSIRLLASPSTSVVTLRPVILGSADAPPRIRHVKNGASPITAFNTGTQTMGSGTVTEYSCSSGGVLTAGSTFTAYNAAGQVAANAWGIVARNEAGLWVWIVERC